jgi:hypothetical protein
LADFGSGRAWDAVFVLQIGVAILGAVAPFASHAGGLQHSCQACVVEGQQLAARKSEDRPGTVAPCLGSAPRSLRLPAALVGGRSRRPFFRRAFIHSPACARRTHVPAGPGPCGRRRPQQVRLADESAPTVQLEPTTDPWRWSPGSSPGLRWARVPRPVADTLRRQVTCRALGTRTAG